MKDNSKESMKGSSLCAMLESYGTVSLRFVFCVLHKELKVCSLLSIDVAPHHLRIVSQNKRRVANSLFMIFLRARIKLITSTEEPKAMQITAGIVLQLLVLSLM